MSRLVIEVVEELVEDLLKKDDEVEDIVFGKLFYEFIFFIFCLYKINLDLIEVYQDLDIDDQYYIDYDFNGIW